MAFGDFTVDRNSTKYVLGSGGSYVSYATDEPAFEFNSDGSYKGLLVEPASTNEVRNGSATGATLGVIGSGGAFPTNWSTPQTIPGISIEVMGTGTENGVSYIELKFSGTATATGTARLAFESGTQIVAAPSEVWTTSFFAKTVNLANPYDSVYVQQVYRDGAGGYLSADFDAKTLTSSLARYSETGTAPATTGHIVPEIVFSFTNGQAYDFTVRVGWVQIEESPIATSPIPTTTASVTRNADDINLTSASSLIGQTEGTLYVEVDTRNATGVTQNLLYVTDNTNNNGFHIAKISANDYLVAYYRVGGSTIVNPGFPTNPLTSGINKYAFAYTATTARTFQNGSAGTETTGLDASAMTTLTDIDIGQGYTAASQANMWIRAVALFTRRLSDAEAQALTTL